jgi:hypothetical protein
MREREREVHMVNIAILLKKHRGWNIVKSLRLHEYCPMKTYDGVEISLQEHSTSALHGG